MSEKTSSILKPGNLVSGAAILNAIDPPPDPADSGGNHQTGSLQNGGASMHLPSGRELSVLLGEDGEQLHVRAPDGEVEVTITLTAQGPQVRLNAARLEIASPEAVRVSCADFELEATNSIQMSCQEDMHIKSKKDVFVEGAVIWLN